MKRALVAAALFLLFVIPVAVLTRPDHFAVTRTVTVAAPPDATYDLLLNVHGWPAWSKWGSDRVPGSDVIEGPESAPGARWSWQTKKGRLGLEVLRATPKTQVVFKVLGDSPAKPELTFDLAPAAPSGTAVTVRFEGGLQLLGKAVSIVKPPEAVVGPSLDRELTLLKARLASP